MLANSIVNILLILHLSEKRRRFASLLQGMLAVDRDRRRCGGETSTSGSENMPSNQISRSRGTSACSRHTHRRLAVILKFTADLLSLDRPENVALRHSVCRE